MIDKKLHSPDPAIPSTPDMPVNQTWEDYQSHVRTYNRVLGMAKWFITHLANILVALYFFVIAGNPSMGTALAVLSVVLMIYGFMRRAPCAGTWSRE